MNKRKAVPALLLAAALLASLAACAAAPAPVQEQPAPQTETQPAPEAETQPAPQTETAPESADEGPRPEQLELMTLDSFTPDEEDGLLRCTRLMLTPAWEQRFPALGEKLFLLAMFSPANSVTVAVRADTNVVSLVRYTLPAANAPEADGTVETFNYETLTGRELTAADLLPAGALDAFLRESQALAAAAESAESVTPAIAVGYEGLTLFYAPGTLAPAEQGFLQLQRRYDEGFGAPPLLTERPAAYVSGRIDMMDVFLDTDGDGAAEQLSFPVKDGAPASLYYLAHDADGDRMVEFYYEGDLTTFEGRLQQRTYGFDGGCHTADAPPVRLEAADPTDYSNLIFGPTYLFPMLADAARYPAP